MSSNDDGQKLVRHDFEFDFECAEAKVSSDFEFDWAAWLISSVGGGKGWAVEMSTKSHKFIQILTNSA